MMSTNIIGQLLQSQRLCWLLRMPAVSMTGCHAYHPHVQCRLNAPCHKTVQSVAVWRFLLQSSASLGIYKMDWLASYHMDKCFHRNCPINIETHDIHIDQIHHSHITYGCWGTLTFRFRPSGWNFMSNPYSMVSNPLTEARTYKSEVWSRQPWSSNSSTYMTTLALTNTTTFHFHFVQILG